MRLSEKYLKRGFAPKISVPQRLGITLLLCLGAHGASIQKPFGTFHTVSLGGS